MPSNLALKEENAKLKEEVAKLREQEDALKTKVKELEAEAAKSKQKATKYKNKAEMLAGQVLRLRVALHDKVGTPPDDGDEDGNYCMRIDEGDVIACYRKPMRHFPPQILVPEAMYSTSSKRMCMNCGLVFSTWPGFQHCGGTGCYSVYYCTAECSVMHWPVHKQWHSYDAVMPEPM